MIKTTETTINHNGCISRFPRSKGKVAHKDTPNSPFELLTPGEHRVRHGILSNPRSRIENYLIQEIERAKKDYHCVWGACPEDGTEADSLEKALDFVRKVYGDNE